MYPEKIEAWKCSDGKVYTWERGAVCHQEDIDRSELANAALESGKSIAECMRIWGRNEIAPVFDRMTKDTPLIISHWQCRDTPGYKVCRFEPGEIFVHGDAGSARGGYGSMMSALDLQRYAEDTFRRLIAKSAVLNQDTDEDNERAAEINAALDREWRSIVGNR